MPTLSELFKADYEPQWIDVPGESNGAAFLCEFFDTTSVEAQRVVAKVRRPVRKLMQVPDGLSPEKDRELAIDVFVQLALRDWRNVEFDGQKNYPFSQENARKLFMALPALYMWLNSMAQDRELFGAPELEDEGKN
jgi:hypothetical protein